MHEHGHHHHGFGGHDHSHELRNASKTALISAFVLIVGYMFAEVEGVTLIHDVHVWTIAPDYEALTAHILIDPDYQGDLDSLRHRLREIASHDFGIGYITLQLEKSKKGCTEDHHLDHLFAHARPSPN